MLLAIVKINILDLCARNMNNLIINTFTKYINIKVSKVLTSVSLTSRLISLTRE